jgi:hypothetical protein
MATLILTAVGTAVAGPIGGAIGAIAGQMADQAVLGRRPRRGPRLGDLSVQTSSYGSDIPKLFGRMRVAGTVIWATDLIERRSSTGGGKGRPGTISYSYFANLAVALSARKVRAVHRIWADGKLLRGAAGDFKARTAFRFHDGDEDQPADPLIESALGTGTAPAFRGTAYVVFEELELGDFGNRIPSLTFEIEADPGAVAIGGIAAELSGGLVTAGETPGVRGFAASGDSLRSALEPLVAAASLSLVPDSDRLLVAAASGSAAALAAADRVGAPEVSRRAAALVPSEATLSYYDEARDYQTGTQRARRGGGSARGETSGLAAVLTASEAKAFAEERLAALWTGRTAAKLRLLPRRADARPGRLVAIEGEQGLWKVRRWLLDVGGVALDLVRVPASGAPAAGASAGPAVGAADLVHGPTTLRLLDLPLPGAGDAPRLFALAAGVEPGWRRAALLFSADDGLTWREAVRTAEPAILGTCIDALAPGGSALIDADGSIEVALLSEVMWLEGCSDAELAGGANLASIGSELIQFGIAEPLGDGRFRLSRLLRGRRGTEAAAPAHQAGEDFALLKASTLLALPVPIASLGARARAVAAGIGDPPEGIEAERIVTGESLRPPSPVHLRAQLREDGALVVSWVRRSRAGWEWAGGSEVPLGEERELYSVTIAAGQAARTFTLAEARLVYTAAERQADAITFPAAIAVTQVGTFAASVPAAIAFG